MALLSSVERLPVLTVEVSPQEGEAAAVTANDRASLIRRGEATCYPDGRRRVGARPGGWLGTSRGGGGGGGGGGIAHVTGLSFVTLIVSP